MTDATPLLETPDVLGEGPIWDPEEGVLWRVDIEGAAVHRLDPATGASAKWSTPSNVGCLALRASGGLLLALVDGFHAFDPASGETTPIVNPEPPSDEIGGTLAPSVECVHFRRKRSCMPARPAIPGSPRRIHRRVS